MTKPDSPHPFGPALVKKIISTQRQNQPIDTLATDTKPRFSNEAAALTGELLRLFVSEARHRAAILAECDAESNVKVDKATDKESKIVIGDDHVAQVAAELLMDFS